MADIRIKVSTNQIKKQAKIVSEEINNTEKRWREIKRIFDSSKKYWVGEAGKDHQKYIKKASQEVEKLLKRMKEHPVDLLKMAGVYDAAENKAETLSRKLPSKIIG